MKNNTTQQEESKYITLTIQDNISKRKISLTKNEFDSVHEFLSIYEIDYTPSAIDNHIRIIIDFQTNLNRLMIISNLSIDYITDNINQILLNLNNTYTKTT